MIDRRKLREAQNRVDDQLDDLQQLVRALSIFANDNKGLAQGWSEDAAIFITIGAIDEKLTLARELHEQSRAA